MRKDLKSRLKERSKERCSTPGCDYFKHKLFTRCKYCQLAYQKFGHVKGRYLTPKLFNVDRAEVKQILDLNPDNAGFQYCINELDGYITRSGEDPATDPTPDHYFGILFDQSVSGRTCFIEAACVYARYYSGANKELYSDHHCHVMSAVRMIKLIKNHWSNPYIQYRSQKVVEKILNQQYFQLAFVAIVHAINDSIRDHQAILSSFNQVNH